MANEIIPYFEMCQREGSSLQRGMNFGIGGTHSVILMSLRPNAPYHDQVKGMMFLVTSIVVYSVLNAPCLARVNSGFRHCLFVS